MGYLDDNGRYPPPYVCNDLYRWIIQLDPAWKSDDEIMLLIRDVEPDVERWQFMGRRNTPPPAPFTSPRDARTTVDYTIPPYSVTSRGRVRPVTIRAQYSFADQALRDRVVARLTVEGVRVTASWHEA